MEEPAASRMALMFLSILSVCCATLSCTLLDVSGSSDVWPETNTKLPNLTAWE
jgi:hypothetical protein